MPLPKPREGETKDEFVSRFMEDENAKRDFPDLKQREAVAFSEWDKVHKGDNDMKDIFNKSLILKADKEDIYKIEGIATEYDVIDKAEEIMKDGAFDDEIGKVIPVYVMHEGVKSTIGTAKLSKSGKVINMGGKLYEHTELGKTIAMAKADGVQYNLSIGGRRLKYGFEKINGDTVLVTSKGTINEVSITPENGQAHPSAIVTKSLNKNEEEDMTEDILKALNGLAERMDKAEQGKKSNTEMEKMQGEITTLQEKLTKSEGLEKTVDGLQEVLKKMDETLNELSTAGNFEGGVNKSMEAEMKSFNKAIHSELEGAEYRKALDTTTGAGLIPKPLANDIIKDLKVFSPFYADARIYRATGKTLDIPVREDWTNTVEAVAEGSGVVTKGTLTYVQLALTAGVLQSEIPLTDEMRMDTNFDTAAEIRMAAAEDFGVTLSQQIQSGTKAGAFEISGFLEDADMQAAATITEAIGVVNADDLLDMETAIKKQYRSGAKYYVSTDVYKAMKKFKGSDGQYLWQAPVSLGAPGTFNGYPVEECEDMPAVAEGNYPVLFANFSVFYAIFERYGMESEMDRLASERMWNHITRMRLGGEIRNKKAGNLLEIQSTP